MSHSNGDAPGRLLRAMQVGLILVVSVLAIQTGRPALSAIQIVTGKSHPYLFVDRQEIATAKSRVFTQKLSWAVAAYNKLKSKADSALSMSVPSTYAYTEDTVERYGQAGVRLATMYAMTGDSRYAAKAKAILMGLTNGFSAGSSSVSYNYYLGFSRNIPMYAHMYDLLYGYLTSAERSAVVSKLLKPAGYAVKAYSYDGKSNIRSWHNLAVGSIGFVLEDPVLIYHAVDNGSGFRYQIANCFGSDGIWHEATMQYHFFALYPLALLAEAAEHSGSSESLYSYRAPNGNSLKMMFDAPIQLADAALLLPGNNDSLGDRGVAEQEVYELANKRYADQSYDWILSKAPRPLSAWVLWEGYTLFGEPLAPSAPDPDVSLHKSVGWATLRERETSGFWGSQSIMAMLDYGPHGGAHGHADKLNLDITAFGQRLAVDRSVYSYSDSMHLTWDRQTLAHNTVVVNKRSQPGAEAMFDSRGVTGSLEYADLSAGIKVVQASADAAYGIGYQRLVALPGGYLIDIFRLSAGSPQTYDWVMRAPDADNVLETNLSGFASAGLGASSEGYQHVANAKKVTSGATWSVTWRGSAGLRLTMIGRPSTEVFVAIGPGGPQKTLIPMVLARRSAAATTFIAVEEPFSANPVLQVLPLADTDVVAGVIVAGPSFRDLFLAAHEASATAKAANPADGMEYLSISGKYGFVRISGSTISAWGRVTGFRVKASGISVVKLNGTPVPFTQSGGYVKFGP